MTHSIRKRKIKIPLRPLVAMVIVEDRMQAPDHEWHRRKSVSRIQVAGESGVTVTISAIPASTNLEISVDQVGKDIVVRLSGRIDVDSSPDLRDRLRTLLSEEALPQTIIVDLAEVSYIETSGIAPLIEALRIARHHKTNFHLHGLSGAALRLFEVTGVLALFEASDSGKKVS
jgi:anti-sigma B factor antagonist